MSTSIPKSRVLLPLYMYPGPGAWTPLFEAIASEPTIEFVVIVNPNNGPGSEPWWPNEDYLREIPRLNAYPNVQTVGYVSTAYCERPIEKVFADVAQYSNWSQNESLSGLAVSGIFFDETPNVFSRKKKEYLDAITECVKGSIGILGTKTVIHNPGTSIDKRLASSGLDIATVAEVSYTDFNTVEYQEWLATSPLDRENTSHMIYAVPEDRVESLVLHNLRGIAGYIFVTDRQSDVYSGFGASWKKFIEVMAIN